MIYNSFQAHAELLRRQETPRRTNAVSEILESRVSAENEEVEVIKVLNV